jgi:CubicO group peptidase (beta-lactamase class C family)
MTDFCRLSPERRTARRSAHWPWRAVVAGLGVLAAAGLPLVGCTASDPDLSVAPTLEVDTPRAESLQAVLEEFVADAEASGVTAAVVSDTVVWAGAAGTDGAGDPLVPEAAMAIGSITKTFTAAEVMLLADEGMVGLDDPVADYVDVPFDTGGATVRQLLAMQSGFPDPTEDVIGEGSQDLDRDMSGADWYTLAGEGGVRAGSLGGSQHYNNLTFVVLGDLIETVTDRGYAAVIRDDLMGPAGLDRVWVQDDEQPIAPLAIGLDDPDLPVVDADASWLPSRSLVSGAGAAGGIAADAATLATWGLRLYTGQILTPDLVEQMTTPPPEGWYGLGTEVGDDPEGGVVVGHGGGIGPYNSILKVWPQEKVAVAWLAASNLDPLSGDLADLLHQTWSAT